MTRILALTFTCFLMSCATFEKTTEHSNDYFEGVITYQIDYEPYSESFSHEYLEDNIGFKVILTTKKGNYKKEYYSRDGTLLSTRYLNLSENKSYSKSEEEEVYYWVDVTKNDSKTTFKRCQDTTILNHSLVGVITETTVIMDAYPDQVFEVSGENYFSQDLKVNIDWYKELKEGNYDEIIKIGRGIQLLSINHGLYWTQNITAIEIEKKRIKDDEIRVVVPKDAILKEL